MLELFQKEMVYSIGYHKLHGWLLPTAGGKARPVDQSRPVFQFLIFCCESRLKFFDLHSGHGAGHGVWSIMYPPVCQYGVVTTCFAVLHVLISTYKHLDSCSDRCFLREQSMHAYQAWVDSWVDILVTTNHPAPVESILSSGPPVQNSIHSYIQGSNSPLWDLPPLNDIEAYQPQLAHRH